MREHIIDLLGSLDSGCVFSPIKSIIESQRSRMISDQPGSCCAKDLVLELGIRSQSAENSGISLVGMEELITALRYLPGESLIYDFAFKYGGQTAIIYLDANLERVIGATLIGEE